LDETFDVGVDSRTSVNDNDDKVPFRFTMTSPRFDASEQTPTG
jgi:hypothetical protein